MIDKTLKLLAKGTLRSRRFARRNDIRAQLYLLAKG